MNHKQFVLLSGGLDSSTLLLHAMDKWPLIAQHGDYRLDVRAISIDYGQRHKKELDHASALCRRLDLQHDIINIGSILSGSMLTSADDPIPNASYADLPAGISPTYVPFRNGLFLSVLAATAQRWVGKDASRHATIYIGAHAEDAERDAYPDCSVPFLDTMATAIKIGTYSTVSLEAPFAKLSKAQIVSRGAELHVPFDLTWSCYAGGEHHCGTCPTCRARKAAFYAASVTDPTIYQHQGA